MTDAGRDVHGVAQQNAFADAALVQALLDLGSDIDELPASRGVETTVLYESSSWTNAPSIVITARIPRRRASTT